jgi:AhpD family alkylhydroperoxidase
MMNYFQKRSFNLQSLIRSLTNCVRNFGSIVKTFTSKRISPQFAEKIMLALTSVNKCRYCALLHTSAALRNGCTQSEISAIFSFKLDNLKEDEIAAIAFAQNYAQNNAVVNRDDLKALISCYGKEKARDILNYIYAFYIGNLSGNTVDAFRSRLKRKPAENGSFLLEFLMYSLGFPVFSLILLNKYRK